MRLLITILLLLSQGCADLGYYWHSARGHLAVMNQRVDIEDILNKGQLEASLRERLLLVQKIRRFSVERLHLPDNDSYHSYVKLERPYVIQNLFAAPEFSTRLYQWCYPIIGCASYRGYYDEERMLRYIQTLKSQGLEVHIGQVSAYSTLGWFDDPVLSSFIDWPDYRLAGLLFHELSHQRVYIDDDTTFNESFASAVQQAGTELWLSARDQTSGLAQFHSWLVYRDQVLALIEATTQELDRVYAINMSDAQKRERKAAVFAKARDSHIALATAHNIEAGFSDWFAGELNNAKIGSVAAYNAEVPAFMAMLRAHENDFEAFYAYVAKIAKFDKPARDHCLEAWEGGKGASDICE